MTTRGVALALAVLAIGAGCNTGPVRRDDATDPGVYRTCQDAAAAAAWLRAQAALANGDDTAALPDLLTAVRGCPDLVRAHVAYQEAAQRLGGEVAAAMVAFYRSLPAGKTPVAAYLRARLADTAYAQSNALDTILARDPSFAWAHLSRARINRRQGRLLPALEMFGDAIVNDADLVEARLERAQVLAELGRDEESAREYKAYLQKAPDDVAAARGYLTLLLYRLGRIDEAWQVLDRLQAKAPKSLDLRMDRAAALWRARRPREAVDAYLAILREDPTVARAALNIGLLYYEVAPQNDREKPRYWPAARAALRWFLLHSKPTDGHEQFERTMAVPFRLDRIEDMLGKQDAPPPPTLDEMRWPDS